MTKSRTAFPNSLYEPGMNLVEYYAGQYLAGVSARGISDIDGVATFAFKVGEAMAAEAQKRRERTS